MTRASATALAFTLASVLIAAQPVRSAGFDASVCSADGVTRVPDFAEGRDSDQCLLVVPDPAKPLAAERIQWEWYDMCGVSGQAANGLRPAAPCTTINHDLSNKGVFPDYRRGCDNDTGDCTLLFWNTTFDNYLLPGLPEFGSDVFQRGKDNYKLLWFKNSRILNGYKCSGGEWTGPLGQRCTSSNASNSHNDGMQWHRSPVISGGWFLFQDSEIVNSNRSLIQMGGGSENVPNLMFQGAHLALSRTRVGAADNWVKDCNDRHRSGNQSGVDNTCCTNIENKLGLNGCVGESGNRAFIDIETEDVWLVDVTGNIGVEVRNAKKTVIVNTGCGIEGCDGETDYLNGWPHPLWRFGSKGPNSCPNGQYEGHPRVIYCYTSLEAALADTSCEHCPHARPPFVHLSAAGWEDPPEGSDIGLNRPAKVRLFED